jgi:hypothetical protein
MHSSNHPLSDLARTADAYHRVGLTHPAVIDAYVERRIQDPALISNRHDISYADFFRAPAE